MSGESQTHTSRITIITTIISTITALLVAYNSITINSFDKKLREVESERELNFRIYKSIAEALESDNPKRIRAVRAIVEVMASDKLREGFLEALESGEVRIYEKEEALKPLEFAASQEAPAAVVGSNPEWYRWNYDVFWCSDSGSRAESISEMIKSSMIANGFDGRIRARLLPESVKNRKTFGKVEPYQIRVEPGKEKENVRKIANEINKVSGLKERFDILTVSPSNPTPGYVSVFICPTYKETSEKWGIAITK